MKIKQKIKLPKLDQIKMVQYNSVKLKKPLALEN